MTDVPALNFTTPRVQARLLAADDLDLYLRLYTSAEVMRHVPGGALSIEAATAQFQRVLAYNAEPVWRGRYWQLADLHTHEPLGLASLTRLDSHHSQCAEAGLLILSNAQNTRVGQQVLATLIEATLSRQWPLNVDELVCRNCAANLAASQLVLSLGFKPAGNTSDPIRHWRITRDISNDSLAHAHGSTHNRPPCVSTDD